MKTKVICLMVLLYCGSAFAFRPLTTDDCGTVEKGKTELETGFDRSFEGENGLSMGMVTTVKHGITDSLDLGFGFTYNFKGSLEERFTDPALFLKLQAIKDLFSVSFSNTLGQSSFSINAILSLQLQPLLIDINTGYNSSGADDIKGTASFGLAVKYPLAGFILMGELYGDEYEKCWLVGARTNLLTNLYVDVGVGTGISEISDRFTAGIHLEY